MVFWTSARASVEGFQAARDAVLTGIAVALRAIHRDRSGSETSVAPVASARDRDNGRPQAMASHTVQVAAGNIRRTRE